MARKRSVLEGISKPLVGNHKKARHFTQEEHKAISAGFKTGGCLAIEEDCYEIPVQTLHVISDKSLSSLITICHSFPHRQRRGSTLRWPMSLTDVSRKWKEIQPLPQQACGGSSSTAMSLLAVHHHPCSLQSHLLLQHMPLHSS